MADFADILAEIRNRAIAERFSLKKLLFKEQLAFVLDTSPFKTAVCSRRSGKTVACAADLCHTANNTPGSTVLYLTGSRSDAKRIVWPEVKRINRLFNLGGHPNESDLSMRFEAQDSMLYCSGASDRTEIEKFRGLALKKAYIDECQSFPEYLKELVDDVVSPSLMDYAGTLCLIGTPGPVPTGFFHTCANSPDWSHHEWTFWQNPYIAIKSGQTHQALLERELKRRGVTIDDPSIQREWFGKWVLDTNSLVFDYDPVKNHFDTLPPGNYTYILGIDFGYEDSDALALLAWSEKSPTTYLIEERVTPKQGLTELVAQIEELRKTYNISKMVADFGGLGKKISEEIIRRFQLPLTPADKTRKIENIALFNDAMRRTHFKARRQSRFASDSRLVEWDRDKTTPDRKVISDRFHSDILDAALYAFKESPAFTWTPDPVKPIYGTPEWANAEVEAMEQAAIEHFSALSEEKDQWNWGQG